MLWIAGVVAGMGALGSASTSPRHSPDAPQSQVATCSPGADEMKRLLALAPSEFDQDTSTGWRRYASRGCYVEAANLIDRYADGVTEPKWRAALQFHRFQMLAFSGNVDGALASLGRVRRLDEERNADAGWRLYVAGTEAFLRRNRQGVEANLEALMRFADQHGPTERVAVLNANVLRGFIRCFDQPYKVAYGPPCADRILIRPLTKIAPSH